MSIRKDTLNWYDPAPADAPVRYPRRIPKRVVPSYIGESNQVLNMLMNYTKGGTHVHDHSPYGNHGTIYGAKWTDEHSPSWALDFARADGNYVEVPHDSSLHPSEEVSISAWVRPEASVDWQGIAIKGADGSETYEVLLGDQQISCATVIDGGRESDLFPLSYSTGEWMRLDVTYKTGDSVIVYKNASTVDSAALPSGTFDTHTVYLGIGREPGSSRYLDGQTGGVQILVGRILSGSEIKSRFEATRPLYRV